jgi:hypothetical protein
MGKAKLYDNKKFWEKTNPPAFLASFNNAVITLNQLVQKLRGTRRRTDRYYIVYQGMTLHKIAKFHTEGFRVCPNRTSKLRNIAMFKTAVTAANVLCVSATVRELSP